MSEITSIEVQQKDKTRANIYLDEKFYAGISIELVVKYQLKKGQEIDENYLAEIIFEDEKGKALSKAVKYISSTLKTTQQIRDYLRKKDYNPQVVDYVINKMIEYKYLDDEAYAKAYISTYSSKFGKMKLISQLKSRGVRESIIDSVFADEIKMEDSIMKVAEKYLKNKEIKPDTYMKLSRFLYGRGYEFDDINSCINEMKNKRS